MVFYIMQKKNKGESINLKNIFPENNSNVILNC